MKSVFIITALICGSLSSVAQTGASANKRSQTTNAQKAAQARGTGQYHGSKDTTPGSPMGTGGAGGSGMSGSQAGSASETALQEQSRNAAPTKRSPINHAKSKAPLRGSGQYHGSKDTTPGSPMGTGGAGGSGMSGSPASSASESALQKAKTSSGTGNQGSQSKRTNNKSKNP